MAVAGFRYNSSLDLEGGCRAHQRQANPLSLESSDSDRLCSTKYLHPRNWLLGLEVSTKPGAIQDMEALLEENFRRASAAPAPSALLGMLILAKNRIS